MALLWASVVLAGTISAPPREQPPSEAPGGYWTLGEQRERAHEPLDGEEELTVGSVLFSLGLVRIGAGFLSVWMAARPDLCPASSDTDCGPLRTYGWVGVGEGGLMLGTGIVYLAIGAKRRGQHQRWERGESLAFRQPWATRHLRFGPWLTPPRPTWVGLPGPWAEMPVGGRRALTGGGLRVQMRF